MEEYRGKSPFPAVRCPSPPLAACAHARGGGRGGEDALRGLRGGSAGWTLWPFVPDPALSEHFKDGDRDLTT